MKNFKFLLVLFGLLLPLNAYAQNDVMQKPSIEIKVPYAFATTSNAPTGAVFLTIINNGNQDDMLVEARSDIAEITEIHQNYIDEDDGTMLMRKIMSITVPAGNQAVLKPTGKHIMLIKLKQQLRLEDSFPLTLVFKNAGEVKVNVKVIPPGTQPIEALHGAHEKMEEIILKMSDEEMPGINHSIHEQKTTGEAVNLLKPLVPENFNQTNSNSQPVVTKSLQQKPGPVHRVLLDDNSEYVEDINAENLDVEHYE